MQRFALALALAACSSSNKDAPAVSNQAAPKTEPTVAADPQMIDRTKLLVQKLAFEAYPQWAAANPSKMCPAAIAELLEYTTAREAVDEWKRSLVMYCGSSVPAGVKGLGVRSLGPDGVEGNGDDITSWQ